MAAKNCFVCGAPQPPDELDLTCPKCLERELDLLMVVYGFIHCYGSDYCPGSVILRELEPVAGLKVSTTFLNNWIQKGWLEANEINSVRVPPPIENELRENAYRVTPALRDSLGDLKKAARTKKPTLTSREEKTPADQRPAKRMATIIRRQLS